MTNQNNKRRREQGGRLEDRLTSLHDDLLIFILSFLSLKQCVALSAVCARFRLLLPSIPRLDAFRLDVGLPSAGVDIHKDLTFPRALIRQCHLVFHLLIPRVYRLVNALVDAGVQNLTLEVSGNGVLYLSGRENCCIFNIKSLRSLSLNRIFSPSKYSDGRPLLPFGCAFLTSLKMKSSVLSDDFLCNLLASCPFLETLHLFDCYVHQHDMDKLSFHSTSIKHLILFKIHMLPSIITIDVRAPQLEFLIMDVVNTIRIEAPKVRNASFFLSLKSQVDPLDALMNLYGASFPSRTATLLLDSRKISNILLTASNGIDRASSVFKFDFNLKDQSSTTILTELLKKCNDSNTKFDIHVDSTRMKSSTKTSEDDQHLLHGSTELELINLQMRMSKRRFEGFLSNQKKMEKFKDTGLEMLRRRTSKEQFMDILASQESLFKVSSDIDSCFEMKI